MNRWCPVEMETLKLLESEFHHDGRRPELQRVVWAFDGKIPQGFDYYNPEDTYEEENNLVGGSQQATPPGHRGSYLPPIPTERSVRISRTTLFRQGFTTQQLTGTQHNSISVLVAATENVP
jgi:hypothetical protein